MEKSKEIHVFTDGSVEPISKIGYGASLLTSSLNESIETLKSRIDVKYFENTSSTKLEIQTLLRALERVNSHTEKVKIYTDSQNIVKLVNRKERLQKNNFKTKQNKLIKNSSLYQQFYEFADRFDIEIIKIEGHKQANLKQKTDHIFTLVDRASRKALRGNI